MLEDSSLDIKHRRAGVAVCLTHVGALEREWSSRPGTCNLHDRMKLFIGLKDNHAALT